jgi:hypothetical protein
MGRERTYLFSEILGRLQDQGHGRCTALATPDIHSKRGFINDIAWRSFIE